MSNYKAILWDNDGVLVDTERFYFEANRQKLKELGVELTLEMYQQFFLLDSRGAWHLLDGRGYSAVSYTHLTLPTKA